VFDFISLILASNNTNNDNNTQNMSGQGANVNCSPNITGPKINYGNNIDSINPINTTMTQDNSIKQGDNDKQINNLGNQDHPNYSF
jgi:hypothetical protein